MKLKYGDESDKTLQMIIQTLAKPTRPDFRQMFKTFVQLHSV